MKRTVFYCIKVSPKNLTNSGLRNEDNLKTQQPIVTNVLTGIQKFSSLVSLTAVLFRHIYVGRAKISSFQIMLLTIRWSAN
jgi:hypothetical protein